MSSAPKTIRIKRVYDPPERDDGARVLVDRIWPRGLSKDAAALTQWLKDIAPSAALRKWFAHDPAKWQVFRQRYRAELAGNEEALRQLRELAAKGTVTLLYSARDTEHNQAVVLSEFLQDGGKNGR